MKKKIASFALFFAIIICAVPFGSFVKAEAAAMSNAEALTPFVYCKGEYTVLRKLTVYTSFDASKSTGKSVPKDTRVNVTSVNGEYGKITYEGTVGWINLSYALNPQNKPDIAARLDMLRIKFPAGMYWNKETPDENNADGYTDQPCPKGHTDKRCNYFDGTCQCHGFAIKLGYDLFGMHANCWQRHYDIDQIKVGDLVRYRSRHTVMITGVYDTYFTVADCNWGYSCNIEWDRVMKKSYISFYEDNANDGIYHCPANGVVTPATTTKVTTTTAKVTTTAAKTTTTTKKETTTTAKTTTTTKKATTTTAKTTTTTKKATTTTAKTTTTTKKVTTTTKPTTTTTTAHPVLKIITQPANVSVKLDRQGTYAIKASGAGLKYQWYFKKVGDDSWGVWTGMTAATFTVKSNASWNGMQVRCKVTDSFGDSVTSSIAKVTILPELKITAQPANVSVKLERQGTYAIKASGAGLKYQWYFKKVGDESWGVWTGMTAATFTVKSNASWNGMQVRCKVTDSSGDSVTSSIAKVTILPELKITAQPANVSVKLERQGTYAIKASGAGLKYQWYFKKVGDESWGVWTGMTAATFTVKSNASWNGMQVRCKVTDSSGDSVTSSIAKVTILPELKITAHPANVTVKIDKQANFTVTASGAGLKYQWYYKKTGDESWSVWAGMTAASISVKSDASWSGMQVRCKVTDSSGDSVTSSAAKVTILPKLKITSQPKNITVKKGAKATFSIKASGSGLKYQWYFKKKGKSSWTLWKGKTSQSFKAVSDASWKEMQVRCVITDSTGDKLTSSTAKVTLK